jgi:proteic killer suppression protein
MIESFKHKGLRLFFEKGDDSKIMSVHKRRIRMILTLLQAASTIQDMNFPGSDLHPLKGERKGSWAVRVSGNWWIIFRFINGNAFEVDYTDYH